MKRKNLILIAIVLIVGGFSMWLINSNSNSTLSNDFTVSDTALVTKIFMADKNNNVLTLSRTDNTGWRLNNGKKPIIENVNLLLETFMKIQIKYPVSKASYNTSVKRLATNSVKVEIYLKKPLVNIFGIKLFVKERLDKVYYVGGPTTDNKGTLMKSGDDDKIYVTNIPGFNGYLTERYSPKIADWQDHTIFSLIISDIKSVTVDYPKNPSESYTIINNENRTFTIKLPQENNKEVENYDTLRVLQMLSAFGSINYEILLDNMKPATVDSLMRSIPNKITTVITTSGEKKRLRMYHRPNFDNMLDVDGKPFPYDMDRMYGIINDDPIPVTLQFFVIDNITRPLSYIINNQHINNVK